MRILQVTGCWHPPQGAGGSQSSTHDLALSFIRLGHDVAVSASIMRGDWIWVRNRLLRLAHGDAYSPVDHSMGYPVYRGREPVKSARQICNEFRPSIVLVQAGLPVPLAKAFLEMNVPTIIYLRNDEFNKLGGDLPKHPLLGCLANSQYISRMAKEQLGVDAPSIPPIVLPERYRTKSSRRAVLFINPIHMKGVDVVLKLAERRPDIPFEFVEGWPVKNSGREEAKKRAELLPNVTWRECTHEGKEIYRNAKIVMVPSLFREAWGRVVTEAHLNGLPVITSDRGGLPESVGGGGILLDPEGPIEPWLEALSMLWDDEAIYKKYSAAAEQSAQRREIQPEFLLGQLISVVEQHLRNCNAMEAVLS